MQSNVPPIKVDKDPFKTLERCNAVYNPVGRLGKCIGPLVASNSSCSGSFDLVKDYFNFSRAMEYPHILAHWAQMLTNEIQKKFGQETLYVGMPRWGHFLALLLARNVAFGLNPRYPRVIPVEKMIPIKEYQVHSGDKAIVVKDIVRRFRATTGAILQLESLGAETLAVVCVIACSLDTHLQLSNGKKFLS